MIRYVIALNELGIKNYNLICLLQNYFSEIEKMFKDNSIFESRFELIEYQNFFLIMNW